jgi:hypothetical protein
MRCPRGWRVPNIGLKMIAEGEAEAEAMVEGRRAKTEARATGGRRIVAVSVDVARPPR